MFWTCFFLCAQSVVLKTPDPADFKKNLLSNPGFSKGTEVPLDGWAPFGKGYKIAEGRSGRGIFVASASPRAEFGASTRLRLNQKEPQPLLVSGWSRAEDVSGSPTSGYSLYIDCIYADGTPLWGTNAPFRTGTHGWERVSVIVSPKKPIKTLSLYCLFRGHTGKAWFDDIKVSPLPALAGEFDNTSVVALKEPREGLLLSDQARPGEFLRVEPGKTVSGVRVELEKTEKGGVEFFRAFLKTESAPPKLVTLYWIKRVDAVGGTYFRDIVRSERIESREWYREVVPVRAGATGTMTRYPLAVVRPSGAGESAVLAVPMNQPVVTRLFYHATWRSLVVAFDVALDRRAVRFSGTVSLRWVFYRAPSAWGFRSAFLRYQEIFPDSFARRAATEGIWMPFYDIAKVEGASDFGFGFKEGINNISYDEAHGVLTFRYTEPQSYWLRMPKDVPRTEEGAVKYLTKRVGKGDRSALSVLSSGIWDPEGNYKFFLRDTPWCDGAVFVLNPDPALEAPTSKARRNYDPAAAEKLYAKGVDGEYLDSLEGWTNFLNFRSDHIAESSVPPTFDRLTGKVCLLNVFSIYAFTVYLSEHLHRRGFLLMANAVPHRFGFLCGLLDVAGTETNWKRGTEFRFDPPERMAYRRTLMGKKPYLFLQNTEWNKWGKADSEKYMTWSLFWGMYPGFFSPNAASRHYFSLPELYNRDRDLFKKYVPLVRLVSRAGWEPVTLARSDDPKVFVERWGDPRDGVFYLTVFNFSDRSRTVRLKLEPPADDIRRAEELIDRRAVEIRNGKELEFTLPAEKAALLALRPQ